jgi:hypothetical protein
VLSSSFALPRSRPAFDSPDLHSWCHSKGKDFFFEKKKQKTLVMLSRAVAVKYDMKSKFFASFFQKRTRFLRLPSPRSMNSPVSDNHAYPARIRA